MSRVEIGRPSNSVTPQTPRGHHSPLTSSSSVKFKDNEKDEKDGKDKKDVKDGKDKQK